MTSRVPVLFCVSVAIHKCGLCMHANGAKNISLYCTHKGRIISCANRYQIVIVFIVEQTAIIRTY